MTSKPLVYLDLRDLSSAQYCANGLHSYWTIQQHAFDNAFTRTDPHWNTRRIYADQYVCMRVDQLHVSMDDTARMMRQTSIGKDEDTQQLAERVHEIMNSVQIQISSTMPVATAATSPLTTSSSLANTPVTLEWNKHPLFWAPCVRGSEGSSRHTPADRETTSSSVSALLPWWAQHLTKRATQTSSRPSTRTFQNVLLYGRLQLPSMLLPAGSTLTTARTTTAIPTLVTMTAAVAAADTAQGHERPLSVPTTAAPFSEPFHGRGSKLRIVVEYQHIQDTKGRLDREHWHKMLLLGARSRCRDRLLLLLPAGIPFYQYMNQDASRESSQTRKTKLVSLASPAAPGTEMFPSSSVASDGFSVSETERKSKKYSVRDWFQQATRLDKDTLSQRHAAHDKPWMRCIAEWIQQQIKGNLAHAVSKMSSPSIGVLESQIHIIVHSLFNKAIFLMRGANVATVETWASATWTALHGTTPTTTATGDTSTGTTTTIPSPTDWWTAFVHDELQYLIVEKCIAYATMQVIGDSTVVQYKIISV